MKVFWVTISNPVRTKKTCDEHSLRCLEDPTNKNYNYHLFGKNSPNCCNNHLYSILNQVVEILDKYSIPYIATYGTHLGAVRHAGLIPWDTDIDIGILDKHRDQFC